DDPFLDPYTLAAVGSGGVGAPSPASPSEPPPQDLAYDYQPFGQPGELGGYGGYGGDASEAGWGGTWSGGLALAGAHSAPPPPEPTEAWDAAPQPAPPPSAPSPQVVLRAFQSALLAHALRAMLERRAPGPE